MVRLQNSRIGEKSWLGIVERKPPKIRSELVAMVSVKTWSFVKSTEYLRGTLISILNIFCFSIDGYLIWANYLFGHCCRFAKRAVTWPVTSERTPKLNVSKWPSCDAMRHQLIKNLTPTEMYPRSADRKFAKFNFRFADSTTWEKISLLDNWDSPGNGVKLVAKYQSANGRYSIPARMIGIWTPWNKLKEIRKIFFIRIMWK